MSGMDRYIDLVYGGVTPDALDYYTGRAQMAHAERDRLAMRAVDEQLAAARRKQAWAIGARRQLAELWAGLTPEERQAIILEAETLSR